MSNYESIPVDTRNIMEDHLHLNDDSKNAIGRLWRLYLRVNTYDIENAERELQNFLNSLQQYIGQPDIMEAAIDQKINDVEREMNGNVFNGGVGIKKRKKRKRTTRKTTRKRKRSNKRRKTLKGGKELTALYLNKTFYLRDEITRKRLEIEQLVREQERREREEQEREEQERIQREEQERRRQEEAEIRRRQEEADRIQRERDFWARF